MKSTNLFELSTFKNTGIQSELLLKQKHYLYIK